MKDVLSKKCLREPKENNALLSHAGLKQIKIPGEDPVSPQDASHDLNTETVLLLLYKTALLLSGNNQLQQPKKFEFLELEI